MIFGLIQVLKPFRVAAAIGMSKLSSEYLDMTQSYLNCDRSTAVVCQFAMGVLMMFVTASIGILFVSKFTGVPIFG